MGRPKKIKETKAPEDKPIKFVASVPTVTFIPTKVEIAPIEQLFGNGDLNVVVAKLNEVIGRLNNVS